MSLTTDSPRVEGGEAGASGSQNKATGKILVAVTILLLIAASPFVFRAYRLRGVPSVDEPFDLGAAATVTIPAGDNAFDWYLKAVGTMHGMSAAERTDLEKALTGTWKEVPETLRVILGANQPAIDLYLKGAACPNAVYVQPKDLTFATSLTDVQLMRYLTPLVRLDALRRAEEGDLSGAWARINAVLRTSQHVGRHGCFVESLVGASFTASGVEGALSWCESARSDPTLLRAALRDVGGLRATGPALSDPLKAEYLAMSNMLATLDSAQGWQNLDLHLLPTGHGSGWSQVEYYHGMLMCEPEVSRRTFRLMWTNWLSQVDRPRYLRSPAGYKNLFPVDPAAPPNRNLFSDTQIEVILPQAKVARAILPATEHFIRAFDIRAARVDLLELMLALQLYASEHGGAYPDSLDHLGPDYLAGIPADTFGRGGPLKYRREVAPPGFTVWSIGPDGTDDSGKVAYGSSSGTGDVFIRYPFQRPGIDEKR